MEIVLLQIFKILEYIGRKLTRSQDPENKVGNKLGKDLKPHTTTELLEKKQDCLSLIIALNGREQFLVCRETIKILMMLIQKLKITSVMTRDIG
jgi:hypothetical protein